MKKFAGLLTVILSALTFVGCDESKLQSQAESPVVLYQGSIELSDKKFGLYYGDKFGNEIGVYYVVLSDAMCFNSGYANPYLDSEGDMLVLEFHNGKVEDNESNLRVPDGTYIVGEPVDGEMRVNPKNSYVQKLEGSMQKKYAIQSGEIHVATSITGGYDI